MCQTLPAAVLIVFVGSTVLGAAKHRDLARLASDAENAGRYDDAAKLYDEAIAVVTPDDERDAPRAAYLLGAAANAMRQGEYERAADRLAKNTRITRNVNIVQAVKVTRRLAKAPDDIDARIELARLFWAGGLYRHGSERDAMNMLAPVLQSSPTRAQRRQVLADLAEYSIKVGDDISVAAGYVRTLADEFPGHELTARAVEAVAGVSFIHKDYVDARLWLTPLTKAAYPDAIQLRAHLTLADICRATGDETGLLRHLELVAGSPATVPAGRHLMDTRDSRQRAVMTLGDHFLSRKDYQRALPYFRAWEPTSFCGNCAASLSSQRDLRIAECLVGLGQPDEALNGHLMPHLKHTDPLSSNAGVAELAVSIHVSEGTLDRFRTEMLAVPGRTDRSPATRAALFAQIEQWRQAKDIAALVGALKQRGSSTPEITRPWGEPESEAASRALVSLGPPATAALRERFERLRTAAVTTRPTTTVPPNATNRTRGNLAVTLRALAHHDTPAVRDYLAELLRRAEQGENVDVPDVWLREALLLKSANP